MGKKKQQPSATNISAGPAQVGTTLIDGSDLKKLNQFRVAAYFGIIAVFATAAYLNDFKSMWVPPPTGDGAVFYARLTMFFVLVILACQWVLATNREFHLWLQWLKHPPQQQSIYAAIIMLTLVLGLCLAFAYNIILISLVFTVFLLLNYWSQWLSNNHFVRALQTTRRTLLNATHRRALDIMEVYWLTRPQLARITTMMFFSSLSFSLAIAGAVQPEPAKHRFQLAAYIIAVLNILIGEIVITLWRYKRDYDLARAADFTHIIKTRPKEPLAHKEYISRIDTFRTTAYYTIPGIFIGTIALNDFKMTMLTLPTNWEESWIFAARIIFCIELSVLAIRWIVATFHEMELWIDNLDNPVGKQEALVAIFSLSVALGVLVGFAHNIVFVSEFITVFFLINYWTQWLSNDHFTRALQRTRAAGANHTKSKILDVMEFYWLRRPQLGRITTLMFFASMAFSFALAGAVQPEPKKLFFQLASYAILFVNILVGEIVIYRWRSERDIRISNAAATGATAT